MSASRRTIALSVALALCTAGTAAGAPRAVIGGPVLVQGSQVLVVGLGFAPPNEFCTNVTLRINGRPANVLSRETDDVGTWTLRFRAPGQPRRHAIELRQTCESGEDGSLSRTTRARTSLVVRSG